MRKCGFRLGLGVSAALILFAGVDPAAAESCHVGIVKVQAEVDARINAIAGDAPEEAETRAARLHREPTPASIAAAERRLRGGHSVEQALKDLARARKALARRDMRACVGALGAAQAALAR